MEGAGVAPVTGPAEPAGQEEGTGRVVEDLTPTDEERAAFAQRRGDRVRKHFGKILPSLDDARKAREEHKDLAESRWFGRDRESNQERIDVLLDDVVEILVGAELTDVRGQLRTLETEIVELEAKIVSDREARVSAPTEEELSLLEGAVTTSREEYDARIAVAERTLKDRQKRVVELENEFVKQMRMIGVEIDPEAARSLLGTVTGDDFVAMCAVVDNVRATT